ncbi:MAG: hypothetical protein BWY93_00789 [Euryarchaeota archaeon ADurb.BinA087]|nr:MAG: hypothetical protein BWY93_00789 [Euryarchaeota archaeon ADurb.BinA087]
MVVIIPLYNAEQADFRFNIKPVIQFEPWNGQIKHVAMFDKEIEEIPDAVAIFKEDIDPNQALEIFEKSGLMILPLIFDKAYNVYSVANETNVILRQLAFFGEPKKGDNLIRYDRLQSFLDCALPSYYKHNLDFVLHIWYEAEFRSSSIEIRFHLYWIILDILSSTFCKTQRESPISRSTIKKMIELANQELIANKKLTSDEKGQRLNLIKQNLKYRLKERSYRDILSEFFLERCQLRVESDIIKKMADFHGKVIKMKTPNSSENHSDIFSITRYLTQICLIICLTDFDEKFSRYLFYHTFRGPKFFEWYL